MTPIIALSGKSWTLNKFKYDIVWSKKELRRPIDIVGRKVYTYTYSDRYLRKFEFDNLRDSTYTCHVKYLKSPLDDKIRQNRRGSPIFYITRAEYYGHRFYKRLMKESESLDF